MFFFNKCPYNNGKMGATPPKAPRCVHCGDRKPFNWPCVTTPGRKAEHLVPTDFNCPKCNEPTGKWLYAYCQTWQEKNVTRDVHVQHQAPSDPIAEKLHAKKIQDKESYVRGGACLPLSLLWCRIRGKNTLTKEALKYGNVWYFYVHYVSKPASMEIQQFLVDFNCDQDVFLNTLMGQHPNDTGDSYVDLPPGMKKAHLPRPDALADFDYSHYAVQCNVNYAYSLRSALYHAWSHDLPKNSGGAATMRRFTPLPTSLKGVTSQLSLSGVRVFYPFDPGRVADWICVEPNRYALICFSGEAGAHVVAACFNGETVILFEPNFGEFLFPNRDEFRDTFCHIMSLQIPDQNLDYERMRDECAVIRFK